MTQLQHELAGAGSRSHPRRHLGGAPMLPPVLAYVLLAVVGVVAPPILAGVAAYSSDADLLDFYTDHQSAAHLLALCLLASAVPLLVFTAIASHRILHLGFDVPGRVIALAGGTVAAAMLALSGLTTLALTQPDVANSEAAVRALNALGFAAGGPGFVVFSGLLVAGISIPALLGRLMPAWIGWFGLGIALVCEAAILAAATDALDPLLPVGRFGTMIWMLATAITLAKDTREPRS